MTTKNTQLLILTFLISMATCSSSFAEISASDQQDRQAKIKALEKQMELLKQQQQELAKEEVEENTTSAVPDKPAKPTKRFNLLKDLVKENDNGNSNAKDQVKSFTDGFRKQNPDLTDEQVATMRRAYEDTILENVTGKQSYDGNPAEKTLADLEIDPSTSANQRGLRGSLKDLVNKGNKSTKDKKYKELKDEGVETLIDFVIKKGDTLGDIARRNYGNSSMYMRIYEANRDKLKSPHFVPEGITLRVPIGEQASKPRKAIANTKRVIEKKRPRKPQKYRTYRSMAELERLILEGKL